MPYKHGFTSLSQHVERSIFEVNGHVTLTYRNQSRDNPDDGSSVKTPKPCSTLISETCSKHLSISSGLVELRFKGQPLNSLSVFGIEAHSKLLIM